MLIIELRANHLCMRLTGNHRGVNMNYDRLRRNQRPCISFLFSLLDCIWIFAQLLTCRMWALPDIALRRGCLVRGCAAPVQLAAHGDFENRREPREVL